jgi:hypothetical protein
MIKLSPRPASRNEAVETATSIVYSRHEEDTAVEAVAIVPTTLSSENVANVTVVVQRQMQNGATWEENGKTKPSQDERQPKDKHDHDWLVDVTLPKDVQPFMSAQDSELAISIVRTREEINGNPESTGDQEYSAEHLRGQWQVVENEKGEAVGVNYAPIQDTEKDLRGVSWLSEELYSDMMLPLSTENPTGMFPTGSSYSICSNGLNGDNRNAGKENHMSFIPVLSELKGSTECSSSQNENGETAVEYSSIQATVNNDDAFEDEEKRYGSPENTGEQEHAAEVPCGLWQGVQNERGGAVGVNDTPLEHTRKGSCGPEEFLSGMTLPLSSVEHAGTLPTDSSHSIRANGLIGDNWNAGKESNVSASEVDGSTESSSSQSENGGISVEDARVQETTNYDDAFEASGSSESRNDISILSARIDVNGFDQESELSRQKDDLGLLSPAYDDIYGDDDFED